MLCVSLVQVGIFVILLRKKSTPKFHSSKLETMLKEKVEQALNAQINAEMWSAYLYLSMSAWCASIGRSGMANWYEIQFREEQDHARILFNYVLQRGGKVILQPIAAVPCEWTSELNVVEETLRHEQKVTSLINDLFALTTSENDYATQSMLKWFIDEQVEEEENASNLIDKLKMVEGNGYGLYVLDKELGDRTYTQASPLSKKD